MVLTDYLAKDYKLYTRCLYKAIERYLSEDRERPSELMKVKICISGQHMVTPVLALLEELEKGRQEGMFVEYDRHFILVASVDPGVNWF